jgi:hypothetical protein
MTTPYERTRELVPAGELLEHLRTADSSEESANLRDEANRILRHYPSNMEIGYLSDASQRWETMLPLLNPEAVPPEIRKVYRR